jgi:hypothetical protein
MRYAADLLAIHGSTMAELIPQNPFFTPYFLDHPGLLALVCFGMVCVFITFGFMMPLVGQTTATIFLAVFGEIGSAKMRNAESGTVDPHEGYTGYTKAGASGHH